MPLTKYETQAIREKIDEEVANRIESEKQKQQFSNLIMGSKKKKNSISWKTKIGNQDISY